MFGKHESMNHRGLIAALVFLAGSLSGTAQADVTAASGSSVPGSVPLNRGVTLSLRWNLSLNYTVPPNNNPATVGSTSLDVGIATGNGCAPLQTQNRQLTTQVTVGNIPYSTSTTLTETVSLPTALVVAARQQGANVLCVARQFVDTSSSVPATAVVRLPLQSGGIGSTSFSLNYIRVRFDDGTLSRIVERGEALSARARVRYQGRGLLRATWEVADPTSTLGEPSYRPLQTLHRRLAGGGETVLESPPLPTFLPGLHLVRLRVTEPAIGEHNLVLRYYVQQQEAGPPPAPLALLGPSEGTRIGDRERFHWEPVSGAVVYRLEFRPANRGFEPADGSPPPDDAPPTAALLLPGDRPEAELSRLVRDRLGPGPGYWRVAAYDANGGLVARSGWRRFLR